MTPRTRRLLRVLGPGLLGAVGAGALMDSMSVDSWAVTLAALLGGALASSQAWLLLGQRADRRVARNELREGLAGLTRSIEATAVRRGDLERMERRLRAASAEDEAQLEAYTQLLHLLPTRMPLPRTRGWAASPDFLLTVVDLVMTHRPRLVVDVGSGLSTVFEALACTRVGSGRVVALDHDELFGAATDALVEREGLGERAEVRFAPLTTQRTADRDVSWYDEKAFEGLDQIDLVVVDGPPGTSGPLARFPAVPILWDRLSPTAVIVLDDADREDERAVVERWLALYPELSVDRLRLEKGAVVLRRGCPPG